MSPGGARPGLGAAPDGCLIDPSILIALAHSGNYLVGAIRGKEMVG